MWRSKKFIVFTALVIVILVGTLGAGTVLAAEETDSDPKITCIERIASFLEITPEQLREAFQDARDYIRTLEPENRSPELFKDKVNEYLDDIGAVMDLQDAVALAREEIQCEAGAKLEGMRERIRNRWTEFHEHGDEWREHFANRLEGFRERLRNRWTEFQEMFRNRLQEWREKQDGWQGSHNGMSASGSFGNGGSSTR